MAVDSSAFTVVFCEGKPDSLDYLLLNRLLPVGRVRIRPVGDKYGLRAFIQGYLATYPPDTQPAYIAFRDRDFDAEPPDVPQLIPLKAPAWMTYRASIENYLIDAALLHRYWHEREQTPAWRYGPALPVDAIETRIMESAADLTDYQAVRWALARLKPGACWPEIRTTWTKDGSGDLPPSLIFADCLAQARELVASFQDQLRDIHPSQLQEYADVYRQRFHEQSFREHREYLKWFHGKDHLTRLCHRLAPNFPRKHYEYWAAEHVEVQNYPELQQLVALAS
jgi:hypothetical protein